jgi:hypothetical protein
VNGMRSRHPGQHGEATYIDDGEWRRWHTSLTRSFFSTTGLPPLRTIPLVSSAVPCPRHLDTLPVEACKACIA